MIRVSAWIKCLHKRRQHALAGNGGAPDTGAEAPAVNVVGNASVAPAVVDVPILVLCCEGGAHVSLLE